MRDPNNPIGYYILDPEIGNGQIPVPCPDVKIWGPWFEEAERHVADDIRESIRLSTVFLAIDHQFGEGPPMLFETLAFEAGDLRPMNIGGRRRFLPPEFGNIFERYSTWEQAHWGHREWLIRLERMLAIQSSR